MVASPMSTGMSWPGTLCNGKRSNLPAEKERWYTISMVIQNQAIPITFIGAFRDSRSSSEERPRLSLEPSTICSLIGLQMLLSPLHGNWKWRKFADDLEVWA